MIRNSIRMEKPKAFTFSQFDLTYFTDMNEFIPIMTIDLENRDVMTHSSNIQIATL